MVYPPPQIPQVRTEVPGLRIVDHEVWQAAMARRPSSPHVFAATTAGVPEPARRHAFLLSRLLVRGCCRGKYALISKEVTAASTTADPAPLLAGLTEQLVSVEAVAEAVRS
jgi:site-specific DNA recombinase